MTATVTVQGGLTAEPELRYSRGGVAIASGTIASTDRYLDKQTNEWKDGKKLFLRWSAFKDLAENIAASQLVKGAQVTITGKLHTREYQDRDGNPRTSTELEVQDFSISLRRATAQVTRTASTGGSGWRMQVAAADEPWAAPQGAQTGAQQWGGGSYGDDSPF